ncbi:MAG: hypothetical protein ACI910_003013 [Oleispira sp.]|jgi:hypothetical protein
MLEQQRIEYLQAMGIQLWMPRRALNNAAESNWLSGSESNNSPLAASDSTPFQAAHAADLLVSMGLGNAQNTEVIPSSIKHQVPRGNPVQADSAALTKDVAEPAISLETSQVDLTVPTFELHFALWPCGILWVSNQPFEQKDHNFQTAVSYSLLGNSVPQASYSQFKWPYIEGSHEDQSMAVAMRALTAQWEFMSSQGARGWVATDSSSLQWLGKVAAKALYSVDERSEIYSPAGKKQLWSALQTLSNKQVS